MNEKKLTILHSNDLHGDFLSEEAGNKLIGGISHLSGYVKLVRETVPNTLYCIAGDMLQGSIIDSEYKGLSTIEIMNLLAPDVAAIGNHEVDYGLTHLLFLERCAKFPIVNANLFINKPYTRLFKPHVILEVDGMKVMFIGIITEAVMGSIKQDNLLSSFVNVEDAAKEVGKICNAYRTIDIDFTVLLTHIGFEEDKKLAALLDPDWGVDVIIGGHSHTIMDQPAEVNGILIAQAGVGTDQIGRFDLVVDTDNNCVKTFEWHLIEINGKDCPVDENMAETIRAFQSEIGDKYGKVICKFPRVLTHPDRYRETELGNFFCDVLQDSLKVDVLMLGSGSIRKYESGPVVTALDMKELMPFDDKIVQVKLTGAQLKKLYLHMLRDDSFTGDHTEFYQFSKGMAVVYDRDSHSFESFNFNGKPVADDDLFRVAMQAFHSSSFESNFGFPVSEAQRNGPFVVLSTSLLDVLHECLPALKTADARVDGRLVIKPEPRPIEKH